MSLGLRVAAVALWAGLIFFLSSLPNPPGVSGHEWQSDVAHMTEYAVLGVMLLRLLSALRPASPLALVALGAWAIAVAYGVSDEYHQSFVPNRDANPMDVGFDALGAALAAAFGVAAIALRRGHAKGSAPPEREPPRNAA